MERMKVTDGEWVFDGTPTEILAQMKDVAWSNARTLDEWMTEVAQRVWKFHGIGIDLGSGTTEERVEKLLRGLLAHGLLKPVEEDGDDGHG